MIFLRDKTKKRINKELKLPIDPFINVIKLIYLTVARIPHI